MKKIITVVLLSLACVFAYANDQQALKDKIQAKLSAANPGLKISHVEPAGIEGFYRIKIQSGPAIYAPSSGDFFFTGNLLQVQGQKIVNLTQQAEARDRTAAMEQLTPSEMIVFKPTPPVRNRGAITVFTDVDCHYCRKLHQEVPRLNELGIEVRYMGFPRAGIGSESHNKLVSAWCAKDQQKAMTALKNRQAIEPLTCENPIEEQYMLGQKLGVNGTPAIFLEDGTLISGYRDAEALSQMLPK